MSLAAVSVGAMYAPSSSSCGGSSKTGFSGTQLLNVEVGECWFSEIPQIPVQSMYMIRSVFQFRLSPNTSIDPSSPGVKIQSLPIETRFVIVTVPTFELKSASSVQASPSFRSQYSKPSLVVIPSGQFAFVFSISQQKFVAGS